MAFGLLFLAGLSGYLLVEVYYLKLEIKIHCKAINGLRTVLIEERLRQGVRELTQEIQGEFVGPAVQDPFKINH